MYDVKKLKHHTKGGERPAHPSRARRDEHWRHHDRQPPLRWRWRWDPTRRLLRSCKAHNIKMNQYTQHGARVASRFDAYRVSYTPGRRPLYTTEKLPGARGKVLRTIIAGAVGGGAAVGGRADRGPGGAGGAAAGSSLSVGKPVLMGKPWKRAHAWQAVVRLGYPCEDAPRKAWTAAV
jgi:hypothetical protein